MSVESFQPFLSRRGWRGTGEEARREERNAHDQQCENRVAQNPTHHHRSHREHGWVVSSWGAVPGQSGRGVRGVWPRRCETHIVLGLVGRECKNWSQIFSFTECRRGILPRPLGIPDFPFRRGGVAGQFRADSFSSRRSPDRLSRGSRGGRTMVEARDVVNRNIGRSGSSSSG